MTTEKKLSLKGDGRYKVASFVGIHRGFADSNRWRE
ncbi:hypothetical protein AALP_AA3G375800 [Arabis alpina]|uniref:Uncharacterized protein n=1 Tax=Arabis alpina TaxID=50452 RepID=A0A087HEA8_ARAAL|nr:hypothetical protein AALP_AA3G375800 [Arabis alpina]